MTRQEIYEDIKKTFGEVPGYLAQMKDDRLLELEWETIKRFQFEEGAVPGKYRDLIGLAVSSVVGCDHCVYYTSESARMQGATEEEIEFAVHYAKFIAGWAPYAKGLRLPLEEFKAEFDRGAEHLRSKHEGEERQRRAA